jgi:hypothetical protein
MLISQWIPERKAAQHFTIIVAPLPGRPDTYAAWLNGRLIRTASRQPFLDAARVLMAAGHDPLTILQLRHAGSDTISLRTTIGAAAKLTVIERDRHGPRFEPYRRWNAVSRSAVASRIALTLPAAIHGRPSRQPRGPV